MKIFLMLILVFNVVACNGKKKKSFKTKAATPIEKPVEEEVVIIQEELPTEPLPPVVVINDSIPDREEVKPDTPIVESEISTQPTLPIEEKTEFAYDFAKLKNLGIHIVGRSILHEIRNPAAIYCSNTQFLNHEKIEELKTLLTSLNSDEVLLMDEVKVSSTILKSLIEKSIPQLETIPYSRFCPRIYLAIDDNGLTEP